MIPILQRFSGQSPEPSESFLKSISAIFKVIPLFPSYFYGLFVLFFPYKLSVNIILFCRPKRKGHPFSGVCKSGVLSQSRADCEQNADEMKRIFNKKFSNRLASLDKQARLFRSDMFCKTDFSLTICNRTPRPFQCRFFLKPQTAAHGYGGYARQPRRCRPPRHIPIPSHKSALCRTPVPHLQKEAR